MQPEPNQQLLPLTTILLAILPVLPLYRSFAVLKSHLHRHAITLPSEQ